MQYGLQKAVDARVLYVDMNAFFASIEQLYHPELRGKPVAVLSHLSASGTVLASSYEAKALGISTGTKLRDAKELCPDLLLRETNSALYKAVHQQIHELLVGTIGPEVEMRSIDEATARLAPNQVGSEIAHALAKTVKQRIRNELGPALRCSIGIAPNSLLAKVATNIKKPDGLLEIRTTEIEDVLSTLQLTDLPGVADGNAAQLAGKGIETPLDFYHTPASTLRAHFGIWGQYWWWNLHGYETPPHAPDTHNLSHEHVLMHWVYSRQSVLPIVSLMADRLIHRMCRNSYQCQQISVGLSFIGVPRFTAERYFDARVNSYGELQTAAMQLCQMLPEQFSAPCRKVTIILGKVVQTDGEQLDLFQRNQKSLELSKALRVIRDRHGMNSIRPASSLIKNPAELKEQPGFGRIRDSVIY